MNDTTINERSYWKILFGSSLILALASYSIFNYLHSLATDLVKKNRTPH